MGSHGNFMSARDRQSCIRGRDRVIAGRYTRHFSSNTTGRPSIVGGAPAVEESRQLYSPIAVNVSLRCSPSPRGQTALLRCGARIVTLNTFLGWPGRIAAGTAGIRQSTSIRLYSDSIYFLLRLAFGSSHKRSR
jgi:hypothetical protein